ncbi:MAG: universal stress protein [Deltaproteobacteria bacterium]|nr:universal stress protein [Deltaproteobacteria bacterium]
MNDFKMIVFATDFSENSNYAFEYAFGIAQKFNAKLALVHVVSEPLSFNGFYVPHISFEKLEEELREGAKRMMERFCQVHLKGFENYESHILRGLPFDQIIKKAEEVGADMIILGTHGRTGLDHVIFGSTAEKVVRKSPIPVLTIRMPKK